MWTSGKKGPLGRPSGGGNVRRENFKMTLKNNQIKYECVV
jgi:hypothetical protein